MLETEFHSAQIELNIRGVGGKGSKVCFINYIIIKYNNIKYHQTSIFLKLSGFIEKEFHVIPKRVGHLTITFC